MHRILFVLTLLALTGDISGQSCTASRNIGNDVCYGTRNGGTCIMGFYNGSGLNWYTSSRMCGNDGGRLVWIAGHVSLNNIQYSRLHKTGFQFVYTGLQIPPNVDLQAISDQNIACPSDYNATNDRVCAKNMSTSRSVGSHTCADIGCCFSDQNCSYPALIVSPSQDLTASRMCLGLQKTNGTWGWKAFDCNTEGDATTGYICEYTCQENSTWPAFSVANTTAATGTPPDHSTNSGDSGSGDATGNPSSPYTTPTGTPPDHSTNSGDSGSGGATGNPSSAYTITGGLLLLFLCCHIFNKQF